jgi:hypothetical protein
MVNDNLDDHEGTEAGNQENNWATHSSASSHSSSRSQTEKKLSQTAVKLKSVLEDGQDYLEGSG